jgi:hypothetical protein
MGVLEVGLSKTKEVPIMQLTRLSLVDASNTHIQVPSMEFLVGPIVDGKQPCVLEVARGYNLTFSLATGKTFHQLTTHGRAIHNLDKAYTKCGEELYGDYYANTPGNVGYISKWMRDWTVTNPGTVWLVEDFEN